MVNFYAHHVYMIIIFNYRLEFGDMSIVTTIRTWVYHMEIDKRLSFLLSINYSHIIHATTDSLVSLVALVHGIGDEAQFNFITGFTQMNFSTVVVVDTESETGRP